MLIIAMIVIGAVVGAVIAHRAQGSALDIAQYAAVIGIIFGILGLIATAILV